MAAGLALQAVGLAWIAAVTAKAMPYSDVVLPFILSGAGMAMFFAPVANVVLSSVRPVEQGQASGANNAIRELGGVLGVAVLASIFARQGGYTTADTFVHGTSAAVYVGAAVVASVAAVAGRPSSISPGAGRRRRPTVAELRARVCEASAPRQQCSTHRAPATDDGPSASHAPQTLAPLPLKGVTSGFVLAKSPLGFGYQSHRCSVTSWGCQNVNAAPEPGAFAGQRACAAAGTKVPSAKWQPAPNVPYVAPGSGGRAGFEVKTHSTAPSCHVFP